jgi:hypothetical protein
MTPCSHVGGYKYFRGAFCLKLLGVIRTIGIHLIKLYGVTWTLKELHNLYSSPNITTVIKLRCMRCARCIAYMAEKRNAYKLARNSEEKRSP